MNLCVRYGMTIRLCVLVSHVVNSLHERLCNCYLISIPRLLLAAWETNLVMGSKSPVSLVR